MSDVKTEIRVNQEFSGVRAVQNFCIVHTSFEFARYIVTEDYAVTGGVVAPTNQPTLLTFTIVTSSSYTVSWTASVGGADVYLAIRRTSASPTYVPVDGTNYNVGDTVGDGEVRHFGAGVTFDESGLTQLTTYHYDIFAGNGTTGTWVYLTTSPLEGSQQTSFAFENAIRLNGTNSRIDLTDTAIFNGQTEAAFLFWMKQDASITVGTQYVFSKQKLAGTGRAGIRVGVNATDKLVVFVERADLNGSAFWLGNSSMGTPTAWHHIAIFVNMTAGNCEMYIDNVAYANTRTQTPSATFGTFTSHAGSIGCQKTEAAAVSAFFDGVIDDMVVYHSADATLRTAHYNSGNGGAPSGSPYSHWKFDESDPTTTTQDAIANNDGTLINFNFDANDGYEAH